MDVASLEGASWLCSNSNSSQTRREDGEDTIVFGLLEDNDAEVLSAKIESMIADL